MHEVCLLFTRHDTLLYYFITVNLAPDFLFAEIIHKKMTSRNGENG